MLQAHERKPGLRKTAARVGVCGGAIFPIAFFFVTFFLAKQKESKETMDR
jgi:hypothetical protein